MKVSVNDAGTCRKTMTIEIPADTITAERNETLKYFVKGVDIPGFRKGKAPKSIVAKKYEKEITQDLQERLLPKFYQEALKEQEELKVVSVVDVSEVNIEAEKPCEFTVTVDIEPEFKLPKYEGISIKVEKEEVTDAKVEERIELIRRQHANFEDVEGQAVSASDMAELTYTATVDGKPMDEVVPEAKGVGAGEGYWVSADEHSFLPGVGEAVVGMNVGDKKTVDVTFREGFVVKELSNITATYDIEVTGVRQRVLPEIDEEFLAKMAMETEEQFRQVVRDEMENAAENAAQRSKEEQVVEYLIKKTKLEVPESLLQQQTRNAMYDIARQRMMMGMSQEQIGEQQDEITKEAEARALENCKLRFIGLAIADEQNFTASPSEVDEEIAALAIQQRRDAKELLAELIKNDTLDGVADQIRFNKAMEHMLENAKIK